MGSNPNMSTSKLYDLEQLLISASQFSSVLSVRIMVVPPFLHKSDYVVEEDGGLEAFRTVLGAK